MAQSWLQPNFIFQHFWDPGGGLQSSKDGGYGSVSNCSGRISVGCERTKPMHINQLNKVLFETVLKSLEQAAFPTTTDTVLKIGLLTGLTGTVILKSEIWSVIISELQELMKGVNEIESSHGKYDSAQLTAFTRQLAQEVRQLCMSRPITNFSGDFSSGSDAYYLMPAAVLGEMGYCYMWWKGRSFSDAMFVAKHNMVSAIAPVSNQLENVFEALTSAKRHLARRLETLDWKLDEQKEVSNLIANDGILLNMQIKGLSVIRTSSWDEVRLMGSVQVYRQKIVFEFMIFRHLHGHRCAHGAAITFIFIFDPRRGNRTGNKWVNSQIVPLIMKFVIETVD